MWIIRKAQPSTNRWPVSESPLGHPRPPSRGSACNPPAAAGTAAPCSWASHRGPTSPPAHWRSGSHWSGNAHGARSSPPWSPPSGLDSPLARRSSAGGSWSVGSAISRWEKSENLVFGHQSLTPLGEWAFRIFFYIKDDKKTANTRVNCVQLGRLHTAKLKRVPFT